MAKQLLNKIFFFINFISETKKSEDQFSRLTKIFNTIAKCAVIWKYFISCLKGKTSSKWQQRKAKKYHGWWLKNIDNGKKLRNYKKYKEISYKKKNKNIIKKSTKKH